MVEKIYGILCNQCSLVLGAAKAEDYRELRQELDMMANVGYHPNLVNLIGCCVEDGKKTYTFPTNL